MASPEQIFHGVSCFPLHFMLYRGNLDCFSNMPVLNKSAKFLNRKSVSFWLGVGVKTAGDFELSLNTKSENH